MWWVEVCVLYCLEISRNIRKTKSTKKKLLLHTYPMRKRDQKKTNSIYIVKILIKYILYQYRFKNIYIFILCFFFITWRSFLVLKIFFDSFFVLYSTIKYLWVVLSKISLSLCYPKYLWVCVIQNIAKLVLSKISLSLCYPK